MFLVSLDRLLKTAITIAEYPLAVDLEADLAVSGAIKVNQIAMPRLAFLNLLFTFLQILDMILARK